MAAWYDNIKKKHLVKAELDESTNMFSREPVLRFEITDGERVPKIDPVTGKQKEDEVYIDRDVYIECAKKNKIFCLTSEISKKEAKQLYGGDLYMACVFQYGTGMNMLRKYYMDNIGGIDEIYFEKLVYEKVKTIDKAGEEKIEFIPKLDEDGNQVFKMAYNDDKMLTAIESKGELIDIELLDGEVYFKSTDLELLCKTLKAKKTKKTKKATPFSNDYLMWDKYEIPESDLEPYSTILNGIKVKNGIEKTTDTDEMRMISLKSGQKINKINKKFKDENPKLELDTIKYKQKIRGTKELIHKIGKWNIYIKFLNENI